MTTHPKLEPLSAWEKIFCIEVGAMPWERFVESKKNLYEHDKNKLPSNAACFVYRRCRLEF
ncbi:hypothetical protein Golob_024100 [Gossypium lobatum]|uniref:Uncharacterized protein n=1 Tax=Gossypium lobatum TaxID=34289 RepID=A0A7J8NIM0_9ROSI|nr:hypothetical protein [Gossypium lobatum]